MSFSSTFPLSEGQTVRIKVRLEDQVLTPEAMVLRAMPGVTATGKMYGLQFKGLAGQDENSIFQAVQNWQRADASSRFE